MTPAPAAGKATRQATQILLKLPSGHVYLTYKNIEALIEGGPDPDQVMIVDKFGAEAGYASISYDLERLFIHLPGGARFQLWINQVVKLRAGKVPDVPIRVLAEPGDPTRPVYYQPWRGASA